MTPEPKFSDGTTSGYEELPVPAAWLSWTRGNAALAALRESDPGAFFGGWRAFVKNSKDDSANPPLPLPTVQRVSEDGKNQYAVYASNVIAILPVQHRTRFERREKVTDESTGREYERTVEVADERREGFSPHRQVFGLIFGPDYATSHYGVLRINKWSAFISFEKAGQKWNKIKVPSGKALIRRFGSLGEVAKGGTAIMPKFEVFGQSRSTPIEALGLDDPRLYTITEDLNQLYEDTLAWKNCERWNAVGSVAADDTLEMTTEQKFLSKVLAMEMTDADIQQLMAEAGSYEKALAMLEAPAPAAGFVDDLPDMDQSRLGQ